MSALRPWGVQEGAQRALLGAKMPPIWPPESPRIASERGQERTKRAQERPKRSLKGFKKLPRGL